MWYLFLRLENFVVFKTTHFLFDSYVSRQRPNDSASHEVLGVQQFKPLELAEQINLNMNNAWGILMTLIDIFLKKEQGKYLILKDPNKVALPTCTFDIVCWFSLYPIPVALVWLSCQSQLFYCKWEKFILCDFSAKRYETLCNYQNT